MNTHEGYSKKTISNANVLLAGGGDKSLSDFLSGIQYVSASKKIQYKTAADDASWQDLVTLVTTDENVKQTPKTDDVNRPLMMINGGTSAGEQTSTSMFSTGIYANASTKMITANGFVKVGSDSSHVLLGDGEHKALSDFSLSSHNHTYIVSGGGISNHIDGTLQYVYHVSNGTSGVCATTDNSNAIITVNRHEGNYDSQFGLGSDGRLYYRSYSAQSIESNVTKAWNKVAWVSEIPTKASWNYDDVYLKLSGGTMTGIITGSNGGGSWGYDTTKKASLYKDTPPTSNYYFPVIGGVAGSGVWSYGFIGTSNYSFFSWDKSDGTHIDITLRNVGGTIALLSDIPSTYPWSSITDKPDTATRWPTWDEVTNKPSTFPSSAHDHERILPTHHDSNAPSPKDKGASLTLQFSYQVIGTDWWNVLNMRSYGDYNYLSAQILTPAGNPGSDIGYGDMYWRLGRQSTWITARKILDDLNSSVSKSGETLTVKIGGNSQSLTNTWRGITDSYSGTNQTISLSLKGANDLYNALNNGNADTVDYYHALTLTGSEGRNLIRSYDIAKSGSGYLVASYQPTEYLLRDEVYTCTFEILANGRTNPVPHLGNGRYCQFSSTITSGTRGVYSVTFTCSYTATNDSDARFDFYIRSAESGSTTIYRIKLERGPRFTGWSAAPEDLMLLYSDQTVNGTKTFNSIITGSITGNAGTADKWKTARTLTIGSTGKDVDGSGNVSWTLAEIGAQPAGSYQAAGNYAGSNSNGGPANNLICHDIRGNAYTPNAWGNTKQITGFFNNSGTPSSDWYSGITVRGWSNGYASWLLCGYSSTGSGADTLYFRSGNNTTWNSWYSLIHSGNIGSLSVNYANSAGSVAWGNITGKPSTFPPSAHDHSRLISGYGVTDHVDKGLLFAYSISSGTSGSPATTNNSNAIITINRHDGDYDSLIGFGSDGRIKYRSYTAQAIADDVTKTWNVLAYKSELTWSEISSKPETATRWPSWSEVTSKPSTFPPSGHTHDHIEGPDWRSNSHTPQDYMSTYHKGSLTCEFSSSSVLGISAASNGYSALVTITPWGDASGGLPAQLACGNNGWYFRCASSTTAWTEFNVYWTSSGNVYASNFYTTSDRAKKQNISSFSEHIRKFQLKDTEKWHYGVIAQEVEEMFRDGEEGNMTVNYNSVLSFYIGQLENKVKILEERIKRLESK